MNYGLCYCGCGLKTNIIDNSDPKRGYVFGEPFKYVLGHQNKKTTPEYVALDNGCWQWQRALDTSGYGQIWIRGKAIMAHRLYYEKKNGKIGDFLTIDHLCKNRKCVNPDHLEAVTAKENTRRGGNTILNKNDVTEIKNRLRAAKHGDVKKIAKQYSVHPATISAIRSGRNWGDIL